MSSSAISRRRRPRRTRRINLPNIPSHRGIGNAVTYHTSIFGDRIMDPTFPVRATRRDQIHTVTQHIDQSALSTPGPYVTSTLGFAGASTYITFAMTPQSSTFAGLYDEYRINMVEVAFVPRLNVNAELAASSAPNVGLFATSVDGDDATAPVNFAYLQQREDCAITTGFERQVRTFVPKTAVAMYSGAFTAYGIRSSPWLNTSSGTVQHFGLKYGANATSQVVTLDIVIRLSLSFRNVV
jgi:hypothetical protein